MASQSLYRKWRSQTFEQLVGQDHVLQTLRNAIREDRVAHAYLFTGPRGVGKTSMARLLAKAVNCTADQEQRPCGICEACQSVTEGRMVDVIEMDAASHTSVDDARELIERVQFRPTTGRYKVYVIDEVHMLSTAAFNALLKTLEEPPEHAIFIMATTEIHKVPATILSRCQRFTFTRHTIPAITAHLRHIASEEQVVMETGVAEAIARSATGSMRDALGVLEQLASFSGGTITLEQVQNLLGMSSATEVQSLIEALIAGNLQQALQVINEVADQGADMRQFTRDLIDHLRTLMLLQATGDRSLLDVSDDDLVHYEQWVQQAHIGAVMHWIKLLSNLDYQLRTSPYGHLPLELATVEALVAPAQPAAPVAANLPPPPPRKPAPQKPKKAPAHAPSPPNVATAEVAAKGHPEPDQPAPVTPPSAAAETKTVSPEPPVAAPPPSNTSATPVETPPPPPPSPEPQVDSQDVDMVDTSIFDEVEAVWTDVIRDVRPYDPALQAFLRGVRPIDVEDNTIVLLANSTFHKENIEKPRNRQIVEEVLSKHMHSPYTIRCTVETRSKKNDFRRQVRDVRKDPLVRAAINIFGAEVVEIDESEMKEE